MNKPMYKSKTINSVLVIVVIIILNMAGVGEDKVAETIDSMDSPQGNKKDIKNMIALVAAGGAIYGRRKANEKE